MIFRKYYFNIIIRIILIAVTSLLAGFLFFSSGPDLSLFIVLALFIIQVIYLINYLNRTHELLTFFFDSVKNEDSSLVFSEKTGSKSFDALHASLNILNNKLHEARMEITIQEKFYQAVVESAATALVVFDCNGQVKLANSAIKEMFGIYTLNNINQLQKVSARLTEIFRDIKPGESKTINVLVNGDAIHLSIAAVCINIRNEEVKLIALHDISRDLDRQEIESWQKLIRILNHEIMNSVAPITSLSATLSGFFIKEGNVISPESVSAKTITDTIKGLSVIEDHGKGLINFVESYRSLTKLPRPVLKEVSVSNLFERVSMLSASLMPLNSKGERGRLPLSTQVTPAGLEVNVDEELIIRVLLNLVKNSFESFENPANAAIFLEAGTGKTGKTWIKITDNGPGIPPEIQDNIFVPFFTTKEGGNGIGLSLAKQIINMHKGTISIHSIQGEGTSISIYL